MQIQWTRRLRAGFISCIFGRAPLICGVSHRRMAEGVQFPDIIDKVIQEKDGSVALVMREDRPWDGSEERLSDLRKKINTYGAYVRQGQLRQIFQTWPASRCFCSYGVFSIVQTRGSWSSSTGQTH